MLSAQAGFTTSAIFNGTSIFVTAFPVISLIINYRRLSNQNLNEKTLEISNNNDGTMINDNKTFSYGEYTFTDNLKQMKNATMVCLISLFLRCIVSFALDIGRATYWNVSILTGLIAIQSLLYFVAKTCLYYIFILRIMYAFKGNKFAVPRTTMVTLMSIFVAMSLGFLAMMVVLIFSTNLLVFGLMATFAFVCDTVLSLTIVLLFLKRLKMISKDFGYNFNTDGDVEKEVDVMIDSANDEIDNDKKLSNDKLNYIDIITRYTLISFIAIFSCIVWEYLVTTDTISIALNPSLNTPGNISLIKLIQWILLPIDAILNVWCIYFNNAFSTSLYYKMCGKCHVCCKKCFT